MIAEELALYIQKLGHGVQGTTLFNAYQPDNPDNCITVYDVSTSILEESQALAIDQYGVQILVRNETYNTARDKLIAIHKDLVGFGGEPFIAEGSMISVVYADTAPNSIGKDEKGRDEWSAHYRVRVESIGDKFRN